MDNKVYHPKPNWLGWIKWQTLYKEMTITCCDCGLAHKFQFRVYKNKPQWRAKRNKEITKQAREKL